MATGISSPLALGGMYPSVDGRYVAANGKPFTSVSNAESALNGFPSKLSESCVGLTVLVKESGWVEAKEYWVQPKGTTPETYGLVEKGAGTTDYNDLDNKPTIGDGTNTALPIVGNVKVSASTASGSTAGVTVTPGQNTGEIEMQFTLPKGADGADGQDGAPGADAVNPFKGYYPSGVSKPVTGAVGDYLYAPPSDSQSTATATIWHYDANQTPPWTDTEIDVSAVVALEFGSGQSVSATKIKDENGEEVSRAADVLSAEAGKKLGKFTGVPLTVDNADEVVMHSSDTRIKILYQVTAGMVLKARCQEGSGIASSIYEDRYKALIQSGNYLQTFTPSSYTTDEIGGTCMHDGWLVLALKKTDGSAFSDSEKAQYLAACNISLFRGLAAKLTELHNKEVADVNEINNLKLNKDEGRAALVESYCVKRLKYLKNDLTNGIGEYATSSTYAVTKRYYVEPNLTYRLSGFTYNSSYGLLYIIYNSSNEVIKYEVGTINANTLNKIVKMPNNAHTIIIAGGTTDGKQDAELYKLGGNQDNIEEYKKRFDASEQIVGTFFNDVSQALIVRRHLIDTSEESANGQRLSIIFKVCKGWRVKWKGTFGSGCLAQLYATDYDCMIGNNAVRLQTFSTYTTSEIEGIVEQDGYLGFKFKKVDSSAFSDQDITDALNSLTFTIQGGFIEKTNRELASLKNGLGYTDLFVGSLVQKDMGSSGHGNTDTTKVSMVSAVNVPHKEATLIFTLPQDIRVEIRSGTKTNNLTHDDTGLYNGSTFTFAADAVYYRLCFSKLEGSTSVDVTPTYIEELIENGDILIQYKEDSNIIDRNAESEKYVKAVMRKWYWDNNTPSESVGISHDMPIFAHISDIHGDAIRFRQFMDYCDYLGVDAALVSGDMIALYPSTDETKYIDYIADTHNTMTLMCVGNHDGYGITSQDEYNRIMEHLMRNNDVITNENETYPTYFYKDFSGKKIRVISLNAYEGTRTGWTTCFTKEQCDWFIDTLASTPQDYGVLVMYHSLESAVVKDNAYSDFLQNNQKYKGYWVGTTEEPIKKIIDAFISKTTLALTYYTNKANGIGEGVEVSINADFTSLNTGVEFIAHITGHEHADGVGLVSSVNNRQVMLNICCGNAIYGVGGSDILARLSDLPREGRGAVQDAFNIYAIDRVDKTIRIARVGSNMSGDMRERKYMIIPYASVNNG